MRDFFAPFFAVLLGTLGGMILVFVISDALGYLPKPPPPGHVKAPQQLTASPASQLPTYDTPEDLYRAVLEWYDRDLNPMDRPRTCPDDLLPGHRPVCVIVFVAAHSNWFEDATTQRIASNSWACLDPDGCDYEYEEAI